MLIERDLGDFFDLIRGSSLSLVQVRVSQRWVSLQVISLAQSVCILIEFTHRLKTFNVDAVRFNSFAFSVRPYILHFVYFN